MCLIGQGSLLQSVSALPHPASDNSHLNAAELACCPPAGSPEPTETRAAVLGEFGGLGFKAPDHQWIPEDSFSYEIEDSLEQLQSRYEGLIRQVCACKAVLQPPCT